VNSFTDVKKAYTSLYEVDKWGCRSFVKKGLYPFERHLMGKYMFRKGAVLDVGCGGGRTAIPLLQDGFSVVGVDISQPLIAAASANMQACGVGARLVVANACTLAFQDKSFDYALMLEQVLAVIPGRSNRLRALREIWRCLKPRGILIVTAHSVKAGLKYRLYFTLTNGFRRALPSLNRNGLEAGDVFVGIDSKGRMGGIAKPWSKGRLIVHWHTMQELIGELIEAQFEVIECKSREEVVQCPNVPFGHGTGSGLVCVARKPE
jgi:ubiquinone/menaquinone biosynthesis C-methylase UbiE